MTKHNVLSLLALQSFFLGGALALVYIVGNTRFLLSYGAEAIPYVYIVTGFVVSTLSMGFASFRARFSLSKTTTAALLGLFFIFLLSWLGLQLSQARWIDFVLMLLMPLGSVIANISLGGQAGVLFDIRQMKRLYPIVFAVGVAGFVLFSLLTPFFVQAFGSSSDLLLLAVVSIGIAIVLLRLLAYLESSNLKTVPEAQLGQRQRLSILKFLSSRYTQRLLSYQMLSAIGTQLVIYIFLLQTAAQFTGELELANFFAQFAGWRNVASFLFILLASGAIISRFGLGLSILLNPLAVALFVGAMALTATLGHSLSSTLFWMAVLTYAIDNLLSDGITATSIKTAYQALHPSERAPVETLVEGIGIPVAFALSGSLILLFNALDFLDSTAIIWFSFLVVLLWTSAGIWAFRGYRTALSKLLQQRVLSKTELTLSDASSIATLEKMLYSDHPESVIRAFDLLADQPLLENHLPRLAQLENPDIQTLALGEIERRQLKSATPIVETLLQSIRTEDVTRKANLVNTMTQSNKLHEAIVLAFCALKGAEALNPIRPYLSASSITLRQSAMIGLLRYAGSPGKLAYKPLKALMLSKDATMRRSAAIVVGKSKQQNLNRLLTRLLKDKDPTVRRTAFLHSDQLPASDIVPLAVANLAFYDSRSVAVQTLLNHQTETSAIISKTLAQKEESYHGEKLRLLYLCERLAKDLAITLLSPHIAHENPALRSQIWKTLGRRQYRAPQEAFNALLKEALDDYYALLSTAETLPKEKTPRAFQLALKDEISLIKDDLFLLLTLAYDHNTITDAANGLKSAQQQAVAYETLEILISHPLKQQLLLIFDPRLSEAQKLERLQRLQARPNVNPLVQMKQLATPQPSARHQWLSQSAQHALIQLGQLQSKGDDEMLETVERVAILSTVPLFAQTPSYLLASVAEIITEKTVQAGEQFITDGNLDTIMYIIVDGHVRVHKDGQTIVELKTGDTVGEMAVLDAQPRSADVSAKSLSRLFALEKAAFDELLADYPEIARSVIQVLTARLRLESERFSTLAQA